jgi:hypothetical protein
MKYLGEAMTIAIVLSYDRNQHLGMCGEAPPPQDDAPVRLVVPWKSRSSRDMGNGCPNPRSLSFSSSANPAESWWPGGDASPPDHGQTNRWSR